MNASTSGRGRRVGVAVTVLAAALLLAACGSDESSADLDLSPQAQEGADVAADNGGQSCHSTDGSGGTGPTWQGLAGAEVELSDGETVVADAAYLKQSIQDPAAATVEGFSPIMPTYDLSPQEVDALVAYIQELLAS